MISASFYGNIFQQLLTILGTKIQDEFPKKTETSKTKLFQKKERVFHAKKRLKNSYFWVIVYKITAAHNEKQSRRIRKRREEKSETFFHLSMVRKKKFDRNIKSCTCNRITAQRIMTNISTFFFSFFLSHLKPFEINIGFVIASKNRQVKKN